MISNATPLIFLSKIGKLILLKRIFKEITIPRAVQAEVLVEGKPGCIAIRESLAEGWIKIKNPQKVLELSLGLGETEAISLAREVKDTLLLDDAYAIKAARINEIETMRTTSVLFLAANRKIMTPEELIQSINALIESGYYIRPAEYAFLLSKLQALSVS